MRTMEFSGRNVDEAIYHGLVEMGLSIDQVNVEVVQKESKGLFGIGAKNAVIRITELEVAKTPVFEKPNINIFLFSRCRIKNICGDY